MRIEAPTPLAYSPREAANLCGIGLTKLYSEISNGKLRKLKAGRRTLITAAAIQDWLTALEAAQRAA